MKKKQDLAFDFASKACECGEGEICYAGIIQEAFLAGFESAKQLAINVVVDTAVFGNSALLEESLNTLGEEDETE